MFEYLAELDPRLYERYLTVERNIKSGSNSFYDAYLDLQEQFLRFMITQSGLDASTHETCGALLKRNDVKKLCIELLRQISITEQLKAENALEWVRRMNNIILSVNRNESIAKDWIKLKSKRNAAKNGGQL